MFECFKYIVYTGTFSFALWKFGEFFYGGYRGSFNRLERRVDTHNRILGTFLAANAQDQQRGQRIQKLLNDPLDREDFLNHTTPSDAQMLQPLFHRK